MNRGFDGYTIRKNGWPGYENDCKRNTSGPGVSYISFMWF